MICVICGRSMADDGTTSDKHHFVPKCRSGKESFRIHKICHRKIHSLWTEKELEREYNTPERILEHEDMIKFVNWVSKKPDNFYNKIPDSNVRKSKRRR